MPIIYRLFTVLFFVLSAYETALSAVKISGLITDENNEPLEFATIRITGTTIGTNSGLDGKYTLSAPDNDTIRIVVSCIGYEEARRRLIEPKATSPSM